jgi:antitoxin component of MazEF toxin-antitoxin module
MITRIKKWGNSFGVRLTKKELAEYGLKEGDTIKIKIEKVVPKKEVDLSNIPTFSETDQKVSEHHDKYLYGRG